MSRVSSLNSSNLHIKEKSSIVVSHRKDVDGIGCATLVRFVTGARVYLTDYADMIKTLSSVEPAEQIYVCDLGLNKSTFPGFLDQLKRLRKSGKVHYFDHHPIDPPNVSLLEKEGIDVYHSTEECASVLVYKRYMSRLSGSAKMKIITCISAITDYLDSQPLASKLISGFDRQFLLYEATILSFTVAMIGRDTAESNAKLVRIVEELADGKFPHEIENASSLAQSYAVRASSLLERVTKEGKRMKNLAYLKTKESATGNVANFLRGAFEVPVGVAIRVEEPGFYEISLRSTDESKHDLGKIVGKIAAKLNTSGGGHPNASGARIKENQLDEFLALLDGELSLPS